MDSSAQISRLSERNELLELLIAPETRLAQALAVLRESTGRDHSAELIQTLFRVSETSARGFLAAPLELFAAEFRQAQMRAELSENRAQLDELRAASSD